MSTTSSSSGPDQPGVDATRRLPAAGERALVLGGGGSTGNAWVIGVVAGLFEAGLDATEADRTVGTSSGSTAAAQLTSGIRPTELLADILTAASRPTGPGGPSRTGPAAALRPTGPGGSAGAGPVAEVMARTAAVIGAASDAADMRRRMGAAALETDAASPGPGPAQWRAVVAARLPGAHWPQRLLLIPAVDARTGEPVVFDRHSGVDLVDAVAASTSNGRTYDIGGRRYINGGYRRNENADLAAGCARVLVLSPFGGRSRHPLDWGLHLAAQIDELRAGGSRVETIFPDGGAEHLFGANAMDLSLRPAAARAGQAQGRALAGRLTDFWR